MASSIQQLQKKLESTSGEQRVDMLVEIAKKRSISANDSKKLLLEALHISKGISYATGLFWSNCELGRISMQQGSHQAAQQYLLEGLEIAEKKEEGELISEAYISLSTVSYTHLTLPTML